MRRVPNRIDSLRWGGDITSGISWDGMERSILTKSLRHSYKYMYNFLCWCSSCYWWWCYSSCHWWWWCWCWLWWWCCCWLWWWCWWRMPYLLRGSVVVLTASWRHSYTAEDTGPLEKTLDHCRSYGTTEEPSREDEDDATTEYSPWDEQKTPSQRRKAQSEEKRPVKEEMCLSGKVMKK